MSLYNQGTTEAEREFQRNYQDPSAISQEAFESNGGIKGKSVLDIACGASPKLSQWVRANGGRYYGLDCDEQAVRCQMKAGATMGIVGRAEDLKHPDCGFTFTHTRLLLMTLSKELRGRVISEAIRVAKESAIFIDFAAWSPNTENDAVFALRHLRRDFLNSAGANVDYYQFAPTLIKGLANGYKVYDRIIPGNYCRDYNNLIELARMIVEKGKMMGSQRTAELVELLIPYLENDRERGNEADVFQSPDFIVVTVKK